MKSIIFYAIKDVAYVRLRHPYLEMYKAADLRDYERMRLEMQLGRPPFTPRVREDYCEVIRSHLCPPYEEATDPEDVAVLGYN